MSCEAAVVDISDLPFGGEKILTLFSVLMFPTGGMVDWRLRE